MGEKIRFNRGRQFTGYWLTGGLIAVIVAFALLFVTASPLSQGNPWVDSNAMLSVGHYWLEGHVPFRDFFEQRGPVMYAYYLVANLIHGQGYLGLFVIEVLNLVALWWLTVRWLGLYWSQKPVLIRVSALIVPLLLVGAFSFETGGSPEEFAGAWMLLALFAFAAWKRQVWSAWRSGIVIGVAFALVFWMKYSLVGPWVALALVGLGWLVYFQDWRAAWRLALGALAGVAVVSGVILSYFALVGGLQALIDVYFVTNLTAYGQGYQGPLATAWRSVQVLMLGWQHHPHLFDGLVLALIYQFWGQRRYWLVGESLVIGLLTAILAFWSGGNDVYLFIPLILLMSWLFALCLVDLLNAASRKVALGVVGLLVAVLFVLPKWTNPFATAAPYVWETERPVAAQLAQAVRADGHRQPRLLYYNTLDWGVGRYVRLRLPNYIFEHTNVDDQKYPRQPQALRAQVKHQSPEYVVWGLTWGTPPVDLTDRAAILARLPKELRQNYQVIKVASMPLPQQAAMGISSASANQLVLLRARRLAR
ncbi:hypothetical protein [Lactiplantibacillus modestisalitolerans]|nr:hypothetical protein [Lactiplantibacillus modestisalitolerans]